MKKWVIFHPGLRSYLFGFRWTLEPMFSHLGLAIKFDTKREAKRYARAYSLKGVEFKLVLQKVYAEGQRIEYLPL